MQLAELFVRISADISGLEKNMSQAQRAVSRLGDQMSRVGQTLTIGITAPLAALGGLSLKAAADLDSLTRGLEAVSGSADAARSQLTRLREIAKLPAVDLNAAAQASIGFQAIGKSAEFAERTIKGVANAVALSGGGASEFEGVLRQMRQVASLGKLMGEELNVIIENAPAMAAALQTAFGTTSADAIRGLGLTTDEFFERLQEGMESLPQVAGGAANAFDNLRSAIKQAAEVLGTQLLPAVIPLVEGLTLMLENLRELNPETVQWALAFSSVAAIAGPLLIVMGQLTTAAAALSTALSVGLGTILLVGGPVIVGLTLLSAWFVQNKLDSLAAKGAADSYRRSLEQLSGVEAKDKLDSLLAERLEVVGKLERKVEALAKAERRVAAGQGWGIEAVRTLREEVALLEGAKEEINSQIRVVSRQVSKGFEVVGVVEVVDPGVESKITSPLVDAADAAERLRDALKDLPDLNDVLGQVADAKFKRITRQQMREGRTSVEDDYGQRRLSGLDPNGSGLDLRPKKGPALSGSGGSVGENYDGRGGILGAAEDFFGALKSQFKDLATNFGPLAVAAAVLRPAFDGLTSALGPVLSVLAEPLRMIGQLLGATIAPVLGLLAPILRAVSTAFSYVVQAIGWFVEGLGKFIDSLVPDWISSVGKGLAQMGQELQDNAKAARAGTLGMEDAAQAAERLADSMTNVPRVFAIAARRFQATSGGSDGGFGGSTGPSAPGRRPTDTVGGNIPNAPKFSITGPITVVANNPEEFGERLGQQAERTVSRGGMPRWAVATGGL